MSAESRESPQRALTTPPKVVSTNRKRSALAVAAIADMIQLGFFEGFSFGAAFPPDLVLDAVVVVLLIAMLGFRWRILFALALELTPGAALFPSWTAFVLSLPSADFGRVRQPSSPDTRSDLSLT